MNCVQCSKEMNCNGESVCDGCVSAAMTLMEGCLGGRPTAAQVYRMFDMGGAGCMEQFRPVKRKEVIDEPGETRMAACGSRTADGPSGVDELGGVLNAR